MLRVNIGGMPSIIPMKDAVKLVIAEVVTLIMESGLADMRKKMLIWKPRVSAMGMRKHFITNKTKGGATVSAQNGVGTKSKSPEE
jgi:hypothetical protein